ncbi:MAG TPA: VOC family protein [Stellaceae bacterium]|nr:VOC family protein [Stellaceae bacterium]
MTLLSFGQPSGGVMQTAYVVKDIRAAIAEWVARLHVGPWFLLPHFTGTDPVYRGRKSTTSVAIAMSFAGHMNIELIQPNDDEPSVYKEHIDRHGHGFHHWGVATATLEEDIDRYEAQGMTPVFRAGVPTGGEVVYFDTHGALPGYVELIETGLLMERAFARFYGAALAWDGSDPIRPFA